MHKNVTETIPRKSYTLPTYKKVDGTLVSNKSIPLKFACDGHEGVKFMDVVKVLVMYIKAKIWQK